MEDVRDLVVEAVNARDLELAELAEMGGTDELERTIDRLEDRYPRLLLTRGDRAGMPVAVVWMPDQTEQYVQVAHIEVRIEDGAPQFELVDGIDPDLVAERPAGLGVAEWESADDVMAGVPDSSPHQPGEDEEDLVVADEDQLAESEGDLMGEDEAHLEADLVAEEERRPGKEQA